MVPLQTHGCYNRKSVLRIRALAVVPLQTHGCYNRTAASRMSKPAVVPLQTHGCYNTVTVIATRSSGRGSPTDSRVL